MLPEAITHGGGGEETEESDFTVSRVVPEHRGDTYQGGHLTAVELGFDDRRYEVPDEARELDPVGRSLIRDERRTVLEAATERRQQPDELPLFHDEADGAPAA